MRRKVSNDELVLAILLIALPNYNGDGLILYRGECKFLYDDKKIGFCWTPKKEVAKSFAKGLNAIESGGVLLKAHAPNQAIISAPNGHSITQMEEFEYTCNPKILEKFKLLSPSKSPLNKYASILRELL